MRLQDQIDQISKLSPQERMAGYLARSSEHAVVGARIRKDGRDDWSWSIEESDEFDTAGEAIDPWWEALSAKERKAVEPAALIIARLCRADPFPWNEPTEGG